MANKRVLTVFIVLTLAISIIAVYFDRVILQKKARAFIIEGIEKATGKKCAMRSINFNLFKGIVIRDLIVSEKSIAIINVKEATCSFLFQPFFKKQLIIPSLRLSDCEIFVERRLDNTINIVELLTKNKFSDAGLRLIVRKVALRGATINFRDDTLKPSFTKKVNDLNADIHFSLASKARFSFGFGVQDDALLKINGHGECDIAKGEFSSDVNIKDLCPDQLRPYYSRWNFSLTEGRCDLAANLSVKDNILDTETRAATKGLVFSKDGVTLNIDSEVKAKAKYGFDDKKCVFSGSADVSNLELSGIETVDKIRGVRGNFVFDNSGVSSEDIIAHVLGLSVKAKFRLKDFSSPAVKVDVGSTVDLAILQGILKDTFGITMPAELEGQGRLFVALEYLLPQTSSSHVGGFLEVGDAKIIISGDKPAIEGMKGKFNFTSNQLTWTDLEFDYMKTSYRSSGMLTNFDAPGIQMKLSSKDLSAEAVLGINDKLITFSKLAGTYLGSKFSLEGDVGLEDRASLNVNLDGTLDVDLKDLRELLKKSKDKLDKLKLLGAVHAEFSLSGNVNELKSCSIEAKLSSESLSFYDFKPSAVFMNYRQKGGIAEVPFMRASLYGGTVEATARIELLPKDIPYSINAEMKGVQIERLKMDTAFREKDIAGTIYMKVKLNGHSNDTAVLTGSGSISVSNGKLWQLNLFRGLGVLIFTSDFSNIIFKEGFCDFSIENKRFSTDAVMLKSDLIDLYGSVSIDFQSSITADLKLELKEEAFLYSARKNIAETIGRYSRVGIKGTLKEPKYYLKPDVGGIIEDIAERVFSQEKY